MTVDVPAPIVISHTFRLSDWRWMRRKPDQVIGAGTRLEINVGAWHRREAIRRWILKKAQRSAPQGITVHDLSFMHWRDAEAMADVIAVTLRYEERP